ncbi:MAG: extracellular solute-binding protein [Anaerolineae bacterium]|nr:extracellular solute-binding protein [Anaerolineae bacterium]
MTTGNTVVTRRRWLRTVALAGAGLLASACQPKVVEKPVKETVVVEKVVRETAIPPTKPAPRPSVSISLCTHDVQTVVDCHARHIQWYQEQHPNVQISQVFYPTKDMVQKLVVGWSAGVGDTVCGIYGPWLPTFVKGGYLDPAPPHVVDFVTQDFFEVNIKGGTIDGKLYTIVEEIGCPLPLYNKDVWAEAGIPEEELPETYEQLVSLLPRLDRPGIQAICNMPEGLFQIVNWTTVLLAYGGRVLNDTFTRAAFNSPAGLEATRVHRRLTPKESDYKMFLAGKCGMLWFGPWCRPWWSNPKMNVKVGPPLRGPAGRVHANCQWDYVVNAHATPEQKEAAWDYAMFVSTKQAQIIFWKEVGHMPRSKSAYEDPVLKKDAFPQSFAQYLPETENYYAPIPEWEPIEKSIIAGLERLTAGEIVEEQFLSETEKKVNDILAGK